MHAPEPISSSSAETLDLQEVMARLARPDEDARDQAPRVLSSVLSTAAVLESFSVSSLLGHHGLELASALIKPIMERCDIGDDGRWRMTTGSRRAVLQSLADGSAGMRQVREAAESLVPANAIQKAMDGILFGTTRRIDTLAAEEIAGLMTAADWFEGLAPNVPDKEQMTLQLAREKLLHPLRRLTGDAFVGRTAELAKLADYVGVRPPEKALGSSTAGHGRRFVYKTWRSFHGNPPVFIAGPGGVGKSSLVANFILTHVSGEERERLPFVLLDFDRAQVDSDEPLTLLVAAAQQLKAQFPEAGARLDRVAEQLADRMGPRVMLESSRSDSGQAEVVVAFANVVSEIVSGPGGARPLLWVLDTFEEPQRKGEAAVGAIWDLLSQLQHQLDFLRVVVCGRVVPPAFEWDPVALSAFDDESGRVYLETRLRVIGGPVLSAEELSQVTKAVGLTPLALRLAARLISEAGLEKIGTVENRRLLFFALRAEQIQASLFHRILEHIRVPEGSVANPRGVEEKLRRLAFPGLAVRRVTPEIIARVLARPCGLALAEGEAEELCGQLANQVDIVEPDQSGALIHRSDVRRMMLRDLQEHAGSDKLKAINKAAVAYYAQLPGVRERAEEIYHRLRLGESPRSVDARWMPGVEPHLLGALDDIESPSARVWLANRLEIRLDKDSLAHANQDDWEKQAELGAARYLRGGQPGRALEILTERHQRLPGSPLLRLQAEAHHLLREGPPALALSRRALDEALANGRLADAIECALLASQVSESMQDLPGALQLAEQAVQWARRMSSKDLNVILLQEQVVRLRNFRDQRKWTEAGEARRELRDRFGGVRRPELKRRPALVREIVAELGEEDIKVLQLGVELAGVELDWKEIGTLARILVGWLGHLDRDGGVAAASVLAGFRIDGREQSSSTATATSSASSEALPNGDTWNAWLSDAGSRQVGRLLGALLKAVPPGPSVMEEIAGLFGAEADRRIRQVSKSRLV